MCVYNKTPEPFCAVTKFVSFKLKFEAFLEMVTGEVWICFPTGRPEGKNLSCALHMKTETFWEPSMQKHSGLIKNFQVGSDRQGGCCLWVLWKLERDFSWTETYLGVHCRNINQTERCLGTLMSVTIFVQPNIWVQLWFVITRTCKTRISPRKTSKTALHSNCIMFLVTNIFLICE